jgi:hypothetical protein
VATSSSNKMPLLVDRPLHSFATVGAVSALTTATNLNTPTGSGCVLLVDCTTNDGAVVDSLSVLITEASTSATTVLALLSVAGSTTAISALNTACVAALTIPGGNTLGQRLNLSLPPLSVPVPNLAGPAATLATYPSEIDKKNTGLYIPSGALLYVGVSAAITAPNASSRVHVFAQGGFF